LGRVQVFRRRILLKRAPAERDRTSAQIRDREHHAIAEAVVGHRNVFAGYEQAGLDHVLCGHALRAEMLLQGKSLRWRIADAESELRLRLDAAIREIPTRLRAGTRGERRL